VEWHPATIYDAFPINDGTNYCIVITVTLVESPARPPDAGIGKELKDADREGKTGRPA
jgi:hypothetical protein